MENNNQNTTSNNEEVHDAAWYAKSAYECFIANADKETSDADPIAAINRIFNERANDELKAQVASEGKTAEGAYQFLWAIARLCKQTEGGCHISPETGYAIAMHYFQDVPVNVLDEYEPALRKAKEERQHKEAQERAAKRAAEAKEKAKEKKPRTAKDAAKSAEKKPVESAEQKPTGEQSTPSAPPPKPVSAQTDMFDQLFEA